MRRIKLTNVQIILTSNSNRDDQLMDITIVIALNSLTRNYLVFLTIKEVTKRERERDQTITGKTVASLEKLILHYVDGFELYQLLPDC